MRVRTDSHSWIVPPRRALYMPGGATHAISMRNPVDMRTLYIEPGAHADLPASCVVITPSALLRELITALLGEPENYDRSARGLARSFDPGRGMPGQILGLSIPMPSDARLLRVCEHVIETPGDRRGLADFSDLAAASARTLARLCDSELGMGFAAWRQQVRFHYALEDLTRGAPIGEVAQACGYASASAFTAAFKKSFGYPPSRILAGIFGAV